MCVLSCPISFTIRITLLICKRWNFYHVTDGHWRWVSPWVSHWTYSVTFATDIECGIQIFWTANRRAVSQWKIVKEEKDCSCQANNFSLGNGSTIRGSKNLNATFNAGGKSNWVRLLRIVFQSHLTSLIEDEKEKSSTRKHPWNHYFHPIFNFWIFLK